MKKCLLLILFLPMMLLAADVSPELRTVLDKINKAKGGTDKLDRIKSLKMVVAATIPGTGIDIRITTSSTRDKIHILTEMPNNLKTAQAYDGKIAWSNDIFFGLRKLGKSEKSALVNSTLKAARNPETVYDQLKIGPEATFNNVACVTLIATNTGEEPATFYVNKDTYRVIGTKLTQITLQGKMTGETSFRKFTQSAGGVLYPSEMIIKAEPTTMVGKVVEYVENPTFPDALFVMPKSETPAKQASDSE